MPKYLLEREIPGAGDLSSDELKAISQKSCGVLSDLGPHKIDFEIDRIVFMSDL